MGSIKTVIKQSSLGAVCPRPSQRDETVAGTGRNLLVPRPTLDGSRRSGQGTTSAST